jgi:hypothetical protein
MENKKELELIGAELWSKVYYKSFKDNKAKQIADEALNHFKESFGLKDKTSAPEMSPIDFDLEESNPLREYKNYEPGNTHRPGFVIKPKLTAMEEAKRLVDQFYNTLPQWVNKQDAKDCASIVINKMKDISPHYSMQNLSEVPELSLEYWNQVEEELRKL